MSPTDQQIKEVAGRMQKLSQKLRFLVKICREAENEAETEIAVELLGRELLAYSETLDADADELSPRPGRVPTPPQPPRPDRKPLTKPGGSAPLDFAISD